MPCSVPHTDDEIQALVQKLINEDMVRQKTILDLALQFDNACTTKDDLRKAYEKCNDVPQESRALIDNFLKEGSDKDYELNLSMYRKAAKIEKQMNAKLVWLREKYNYRSQTHIGGSLSQTHEICDVYLTEKNLHQLHLDEEVLRETLEEEPRDEKEREEKIRQKQADDEEFMLEFRVKYDSEYEELSLDIDYSYLHLTPVLRPSSSTRVEPSPSTPNPVRIIPSPTSIVQAAKLLKQMDILLGLDEAVMSTQEYMKKVVEDVGEDEDIRVGLKSCSSNAIGDLTVTMKDLSGTIPETIHYKVIGDGGYEKNITVEAALILANVSVFSPKPSMHYLNITMRNVVKFFSVRIRFLIVTVVNALP
ncbi:protein phosphatase [Tanacetum coccineum]|uniref:Protein phosphatase n=1 Tax=Tanacetum coccineum TaxID=301880 RepID=A0ABQ5GGB1_9ASTR